MAGDDKRDDQQQATKTKLDTIVSHLDAMKTLITGLQKELKAGDLHGHARCAPIRGGNDSYSTPPFTIPPYNGKYDPAIYIDWELAVEQKFSYHDIPAISQVQTAISAFTNLALFWWHHEYKQKHPITWAELKLLCDVDLCLHIMLATLNVMCRDVARSNILTLLQDKARHPAQRPLSQHHLLPPLQCSRAQRHSRPPLHRSRGRLNL
jgi:hypothetical protein